VLLERVDNDHDLLRELVELFQKDRTALLDQIHEAIQNDDPHTLEISAHALKGAVAIFCAGPAVKYAAKLESMGRAKRTSEAGRAYSTLKEEVERLQLALAALVEQISV
jgi:HPt (histidine-containing phosphotransfer) domain-containing protein